MARFRLTLANGEEKVLTLREVEVEVSSDGYVRTKHQYGSSMELIVNFNQVVAAMAEERDLWR